MPQVGRSLVLQGLEQIVRHDVHRVMGHQARCVLATTSILSLMMAWISASTAAGVAMVIA
jgi:hypothetical protein